MKSNDIKILDNGWMEVPFSYMAEHISKRVDPKNTNLDIYIGLEHLDPGSLKIKSYGKPEDVKGTKLIAQPGDIIFGKRRAYQGKVGVCEWDAIVSAHSMVLRPKEENIEKDFLKFFMQSEEFYNRSIQISEGSLSPTIKWKVLAEQRFIIPKKELQLSILNTLNSIENEIYRKEILINKVNTYKGKLMEKLFSKGIKNTNLKKINNKYIPEEWTYCKLGDIATIVTGKTPPTDKVENYGDEYPWVTPTDISENREIYITERSLSKYGFENNVILPKDTLLVTCIASIGKNTILKKQGSCNQQINALLPNEKYNTEFMYYWIEHNTKLLNKYSSKTAVPILNKTKFENIQIALPPIEDQKEIAKVLVELDSNLEKVYNSVNYSKSVKKSLQNKYISKPDKN